MSNNVEFENAIPPIFLLDPPVSSSKSISRRVLKEFLPTENTTYSSGTNSVIRFNIASSDSFLDGSSSYFKMQFSVTQTHTDPAVRAIFLLERGGYKSLFKNLEVYSQLNGTLIERVEYANLWAALQEVWADPSKLDYDNTDLAFNDYNLVTEEHTSSRGWTLLPYAYVQDSVVAVTVNPANLNSVNTAAAAGLVDFKCTYATQATQNVDPLLTNMINVGDMVRIAGQVGVVVALVTNAGVNTMTVCGITRVASTDVKHVWVKRRNTNGRSLDPGMAASASPFPVSGAKITHKTVTFKLDLGILGLQLPLFLMKGGIQIRLELDSEKKSFYTVLNNNLNKDSTIAYEIQYPRFMGMLTTPHGDVIEEYVAQFESPSGLLYRMPGVKTRRLNGLASEPSTTLQTNVGVRSARRAYLVCLDSQAHEGGQVNQRCNRSLSQYLRAGITEFQFKIGSNEFPLRKVNCETSKEWVTHLKQVCGRNINLGNEDLLGSGQFVFTDNSNLNFGKCDPALIMAVDFSRDNGDFGAMTGQDLSLVPLDIDLTRTASYNTTTINAPTAPVEWRGTPLYYLFVEYDNYLRIGNDQISTLN